MPDGLRPVLVLVVDDSLDSSELVAAALNVRGYSVALAFDGREGVERALANAPDVIVMDFAMPRLDGLAATKLLKGDPRTSSIPVLLYTAHRGIELDTRARAVGCAAVVSKGPTEALLAAVADALNGHV